MHQPGQTDDRAQPLIAPIASAAVGLLTTWLATRNINLTPDQAAHLVVLTAGGMLVLSKLIGRYFNPQNVNAPNAAVRPAAPPVDNVAMAPPVVRAAPSGLTTDDLARIAATVDAALRVRAGGGRLPDTGASFAPLPSAMPSAMPSVPPSATHGVPDEPVPSEDGVL